VCTRQCKQQQERAHTFHVTALGFSSQRKRQQERRAYHPNNYTRVQTQGLSQSSSALLSRLACVLNQSKSVVSDQEHSTVWFSDRWKFFARKFEFWSQKSFFLEKSPYVSKGWLFGIMGYFLACTYVTVNPLEFSPEKIVSAHFPLDYDTPGPRLISGPGMRNRTLVGHESLICSKMRFTKTELVQ